MATSTLLSAQEKITKTTSATMKGYEILKTESHVPGLRVALTHAKKNFKSNDYAVLFIHGASFPAELAFAFRMDGHSWMDHLAENGFDVYALDFLGYGHSDRYPAMLESPSSHSPLGKALDIYPDIDNAVELILKRTGKQKVYLIAHSWGGSVASLYASKFSEKIEKLVLFAAITPRNENSSVTEENAKRSYDMLTPAHRHNGSLP